MKVGEISFLYELRAYLVYVKVGEKPVLRLDDHASSQAKVIKSTLFVRKVHFVRKESPLCS